MGDLINTFCLIRRHAGAFRAQSPTFYRLRSQAGDLGQ